MRAERGKRTYEQLSAFQHPSYSLQLSSTSSGAQPSPTSGPRPVQDANSTHDDDVQVVHYDDELLPVGLVIEGYDDDKNLSIDEETSEITAEENFYRYRCLNHMTCMFYEQAPK